MTIIEQLESIFDCDEETQVDGDGVFNGAGILRKPIGALEAGVGFSSYFYDPYTGSLRVYATCGVREDGQPNEQVWADVQATLTFN